MSGFCAASSLFLLLSLATIYSVSTQLPPVNSRCASIFYDAVKMKLQIVDGYHPNSTSMVAWANFTDNMQKTGWNYLTVTTNPVFNDSFQSYAAGLLEGFLTADYIYMEWVNTRASFCRSLTPDCQKIKGFLTENLQWMKAQVKANPNDPYFYQMGLILDQLSGLNDGYKKTPRKPSLDIDPFGFLLFQVGADLDAIQSALNTKSSKKRPPGGAHCSALIKLLPDNKDLFVSHDTWEEFSGMLKIIKKYNFGFRTTATSSKFIPGREVSFSSQHGPLFSGDDFYVIGSGLVTMETTIGNENAALWKYVKASGTVLEWMRNLLANRLASSVMEWCDIFSKYNSGTYNNEWMVVDYKHFTPGQDLPKEGLLAVLDQIPGEIVSKDMTWLLQNQTYWPSYNVPYFPQIFADGGFKSQAEEHGPWFSYDKTARANIFRRDHHKVTDVKSMIKLMRYNDFQHDPLPRCNCTPPYTGENAISARSDLNPANGTYPFQAFGFRCHGGTDKKVTSSSMAKTLSMIAVSGPTHDQQPVFQWSKSECDKQFLHMGHPDIFNFDPVEVNWQEP